MNNTGVELAGGVSRQLSEERKNESAAALFGIGCLALFLTNLLHLFAKRQPGDNQPTPLPTPRTGKQAAAAYMYSS